MIRNLLNSIPVFLISIIATVTGGTAISKVAQELKPTINNDSRGVQEVRTLPTTTPLVTGVEQPTITPTAKVTATPVPKKAVVTTSSTNSFTLATLAQHNTPGSCYVGFKNVVYDVTNHPSWQNCSHHGAKGGRDITSIFPHSTSYFTTLPKVGTFIGGSTAASVRIGDDNDDDTDDRDQQRWDWNDNDDD